MDNTDFSDLLRGLQTSRDAFVADAELERKKSGGGSRPNRTPQPPLPPKKSQRDRDILNAFRNK